MGFNENYNADYYNAKLNTLLADRASGKPVSDSDIDSATRYARSADRAAIETAAKATAIKNQQLKQQFEKDEKDRAEMEALYEAREDSFKNVPDYLRTFKSADESSKLTFDKYFHNFFSEYYSSLLTLLPVLYDAFKSKSIINECNLDDDFNAIKLLYQDFEKLSIFILARRAHLNQGDALVWNHINYWLSKNSGDLQLLEAYIILIGVKYDMRDSGVFDYVEKVCDVIKSSVDKLNGRIRDATLDGELDAIPSSVVLNIIMKYDNLNNTSYANIFKKLLFLFAKSCCGWSSSVSTQEMQILKSYKSYLEKIK